MKKILIISLLLSASLFSNDFNMNIDEHFFGELNGNSNGIMKAKETVDSNFERRTFNSPEFKTYIEGIKTKYDENGMFFKHSGRQAIIHFLKEILLDSRNLGEFNQKLLNYSSSENNLMKFKKKLKDTFNLFGTTDNEIKNAMRVMIMISEENTYQK